MTRPLSLLAAAREAPDRVALVAGGVVERYATLAPIVAGICRRLDERSLRRGARVAFAAPLRRETVLVIHALLERGDVLLPIHPRWTAVERQQLVERARPDLVLDEAAVQALVAAALRHHGWESAAVDRPDPSVILFTSGTAGRPRGATLSGAALVASARASAANLGWRDDDRWLLCLPLAHVGGLSIVIRCLVARRAVVLVQGDRFAPRATLDALVRDRATLLSLVPTMLRALLEIDGDGALATVRALLLGGAAAPRSLLVEAVRRNVPVLTTYGLTEAGSQVTAQRPGASPLGGGSGRPLPGVEIQIARSRVLVRGPMLLDGYLDEPARDGAWLDTGDLGFLDDSGELHLLARRTDLIVSGGENVYPAEVEAALLEVPGVRAAVVVGLPDERWGQQVAAAVVLDPGAASVAEIEAALALRLAPFKRPRRYLVVDAVPLTPAGKPDRVATRLRFA